MTAGRFVLVLGFMVASSTASAQNEGEPDGAVCGVSVAFPGEPEVSRDTTILRNGQRVVTNEYSLTVGRDFYNLTCSDFATGYMASVGVEAFLDGGVGRSTRGAEVIRSEIVDWDSYPGRRYTTRMEVGETVLHVHRAAYVVGDRVYQMAVSAFDASEKDVERFFSSLRLSASRR